jgi:hypothetical protein
MKEITRGLMFKSLLTFLMLTLIQTVMLAQDNGGSESSSGTSSTSKTVTVTQSTDWYAAPWVWVVGGVLLILLLVALLRGSGSNTAAATTRTDRITVTKSSTSDDF